MAWNEKKSGLRRARQGVGAVLASLILSNLPAAEPQKNSVADMSIEQLLNESITSVSKKETKLNDAPAAVTVITQEDIRRSGLNSVPELLRLVPGMEVARVSGSEWAVSARGFNNEFANKLLVLVDGRSVYTPSFGGVHWDSQDLVLEDLERIEVIRGPGATLWGANAVNGVINIITKSAKETQGWLVSTTGGTEDQPGTSVRYGVQVATNLYLRTYVKYFNRDSLVNSSGGDAADNWNAARGGLRLDWEPTQRNTFTLQGDYYNLRAGQTVTDVSLGPPFSRQNDITAQSYGGNLLGRWTHNNAEGSQFTFQSYYDFFEHQDGRNKEYRDTFDIDAQHHFALGQRNDVVYGAGYRFTSDRLPAAFFATLTPERRNDQIYSGFLQDEITLVHERLRLTLGSKVEHNERSGMEYEPSARLLWTPSEKQSVWASISRAARTPTRADQDARVNLAAFQLSPFAPAMLVSSFGNPQATSEKLLAYELGYRIEPAKNLSLDIATFYNSYRNLIAYEALPTAFELTPPPPHLLVSSSQAENSNSAETYGAEISVQWRVSENWKLMGSYSLFQANLYPDRQGAASNPQQQFQIRSYVNLSRTVELNSALYYVDRIITDAGARFPSYFRFDTGLTWHPTSSLEIAVWGQNLFQSRHGEFGSYQTSTITEIPRGVFGKVTWQF
jgi:iron complex outermembrane receptor protein